MNSAVVDGNWHFDNLWVSHHQNKKDLMMMRNKKNDEYHTGCGNVTLYEIATPIICLKVENWQPEFQSQLLAPR